MTATADTPATTSPPPTGSTSPLTPPPSRPVPLDARPAWARVQRALAAAADTGRHPAGSHLRVLAAEVTALTGMLDSDGDALAWLLIREQAVADAWRNLHPTSRADVPTALADELVELAEHHADPADTSGGRELARLRAIEAAARAWAAEAHVEGTETPAGDALLDVLNDGKAAPVEVLDAAEAARLRALRDAALAWHVAAGAGSDTEQHEEQLLDAIEAVRAGGAS